MQSSARRSRISPRSRGGCCLLRTLGFEPLEDRRLLSVIPLTSAGWKAQPAFRVHWLAGFLANGATSPSGLTPNQIRGAYGLGTYSGGSISGGISFNGIAGDGTGQTIAIVDAYDLPNAASDLNAFSAYFGLPTFGGTGHPTFSKLNQNGGTSLPGTDPTGPWSSNGGQGTWEIEESLDIQWAHAMAPMANIILFEASSSNNDDLYTAVRTAASTPGVVVVSMSWGGSEYSTQTSDDSTYFVTPAGHFGGSATMGGTKIAGGVTFFAAAGDSGAYDPTNTSTISPEYPATSPNVVAVGGTSLTVSGNTYSSETTWGNGTSSGTAGGGGGGISAYESQPSYQSGVVSAFSTTARTYPDVSANANPSTGVPVYDTWDFGSSTPWVPGYMGGTSLSAPLWAGIVTVADQGRATAGLGSLDGRSQTLPMLYKFPSTDFHDITSGQSIGPSLYGPRTGYDLATGRGSPFSKLLIPAFAGPGKLVFGQPPTTTGANATITPAVTVLIEDGTGSVVTSDTSNVTIAIGNNPSGGALNGTLTVAAVKGIATFSNLSIDTSGNGYTLVASDTEGSTTLTATSPAFNIATPPTVATAAAATPNPVAGTTSELSVLGADVAGESALAYTWTATTLPAGAAAPVFSANGTNAAKTSTATFSAAGNYVLMATMTNAGGATATSSVNVVVDQTTTSLSVSPATSALVPGAMQQFTATVVDQFGMPLAVQPMITWSATTGSISSSGLFTSAGEAAAVTATSGSLSAAAQVTVNQPPTVAVPASASPDPVTSATTTLSVLGDDDGGESNLTYAWTAISLPAGAMQPAYSINGTNAAKTTTVSFTTIGTYVFQVTISDMSGSTVTSSVTVTVTTAIAGISLSPGSLTLPTGAQQQFSATAVDQFGNPVSPQPVLTWTASSGSVSPSGLYNAPAAGGSVTITAASGSVSGTATINLVAPSAWWEFNEGSGTTADDSSGNNHTGSISGASWTTGMYGSALSFSNGASSVNSSSAALSGSGDFTVGAWIKTTASTAGVIIEQTGKSNGQYELSMLADGTLDFWMRSSSIAYQFSVFSNAAINDGRWHYVAAVRQGTTGYVYIDEVLQGSGSSSSTLYNLGSFRNSVTLGVDRSTGWSPFYGVLDDVRIYPAAISASGIVDLATAAPTIATPAAASPSPVTGTTAALSVLGADDGGESNITYTWATTDPSPAPVIFSANGTNSAKSTSATFTAPGTYSFVVTAVDAIGLEATSSLTVTVSQTVKAIVVSPATPTLSSHATQQFTAVGSDQFGDSMSLSGFAWSASSGSIDSSGLFAAPYASASILVTAWSGSVAGTAVVTVNNAAPTVATPAAANPTTVTGTTVALSVLGADDAGESNLTYTWTTTGTPPAAVGFSDNGSNTAKDTTATLTAAGIYNLVVTITDAGGNSTVSSVSVAVETTLKSIIVQSAAGFAADGTEQFTASAVDQFGNALASQPQFTWSLTGPGQLSNSGLFTSPYANGTATITAASGTVTGKLVVSLAGVSKWNGLGTSWTASDLWTSTAFGSTVVDPGLRSTTGDSILLDSPTGGTVSLDGASPNLASVTFNGTVANEIAQGSGGTLHLANGTIPATLTVVTGSHVISAPVALDSNVMILPAAGSQLNIRSDISGTGQSLSVIDQGKVMLGGVNSYTGGTTVSAGTLDVTSAASLPDGTDLTIGAGASSFFNASPSMSSSLVAAATFSANRVSAAPAGTANFASQPMRSAIAAATRTTSAAAPKAIDSGTLLPTPVLIGAQAPRPATLGFQAFWSLLASRNVGILVGTVPAFYGTQASSDQHHQKSVTIQALDAVFAQYQARQ
jgi:autotransporter-associated beta strand protein